MRGEDTRLGAAKLDMMRSAVLRYFSVAFVAALALASCQGNLGSGTGLTIPQTGGSFGQPQPGQNGGAPQSRQRAVDGAVYLTAQSSEIPLPTVGAFAVSIKLGTPEPSPSPSASSSATHAARTPAAGTSSHGRVALASPTPTPSPSPSPSASAAPSGSPSAVVSGTASAKPSARPTSKPKIITKTTIYPDDAPAAPTPEPSGEVQTFYHRAAIVRGYLEPATDVSLYGLGAVRFTIPAEEQTSGRGFTIALFQAGKKHHETLLASDTSPTLDGDVVSSNVASAPIALKKGGGYVVVLYGDEQPSTPGPVTSGYPQPGVNPFVTPAPPGYPQTQPGGAYPQGQPGAPNPYATPTPYGMTPTPHY